MRSGRRSQQGPSISRSEAQAHFGASDGCSPLLAHLVPITVQSGANAAKQMGGRVAASASDGEWKLGSEAPLCQPPLRGSSHGIEQPMCSDCGHVIHRAPDGVHTSQARRAALSTFLQPIPSEGLDTIVRSAPGGNTQRRSSW